MLLQRVRQFVRQHSLFRAETRVLVALSGGSDSVALAFLMRDLAAGGEVRLAGIAHFNHQLREHASRDEEFSSSIARSLNVPFTAGRADIAARARLEHRSIEDAARRGRYEFLERARLELAADVVALGHTRDDQAETFLYRLIRGAGPRGLASIYPRHGTIVRPLLNCRREELRAYLAGQGAGYVEDETNADLAIPRNRIRAEILPLLADRFNPRIIDVLADEAELEREIWTWLESAAVEFERENGVGTPDPVLELDVAQLIAAPAPLRRVVLWRAMTAVAGRRSVSFEHVQAALELLGEHGNDRRAIDVPGHRVERVGSRLVLRSRDGAVRGVRRAAKAAANLFEYSLSIPGEVRLAEARCALTAELDADPDDAGGPARSGRGPLALIRRDLCQGPLTVRNRRPGDGFRPVGVGGRKKLQDYFVDRKVAREERDRVPLVVDGSDRIVWVAGYGIDEAFRVTDPSQSVLLLRLKQA